MVTVGMEGSSQQADSQPQTKLVHLVWLLATWCWVCIHLCQQHKQYFKLLLLLF